MVPFPPALRRSALVLATLAGAGCSGDRISGDLPGGTNAPIARPTAPPVNMAGRWMLASPGRGQCNMTLGAAPGAAEGTIAPEGGCPGSFFTSRKWSFDSNGITIRNHNGQPLAQLSPDATGRVDGKAATGEPVTLSR